MVVVGCAAGAAPEADGTVEEAGNWVAAGEPEVEGEGVALDTEGAVVAPSAEEVGVESDEAALDAGGSARRMASICATEGWVGEVATELWGAACGPWWDVDSRDVGPAFVAITRVSVTASARVVTPSVIARPL